jgi:ribosomal protein L11 methyltransferase
LSFGTGHHPTTRFCLEKLVSAKGVKQPRSLLDVGTGSGILAIAACKLGYKPVDAFDYDPQCVRVAKENAISNNVDALIKIGKNDLKTMPLTGKKTYDVICANLEYDLLISEAEKLINRLNPNGLLILAGILDQQFKSVLEAYQEKSMQLTSHRKSKEWHSGAFSRA